MLPQGGLIKPTDKINFGTHINDVEEMSKRVIDPVTGRLFVKDKLQLEMEKSEIYKQKKFRERFDRPDMDPNEDHKLSEEDEAILKELKNMTLEEPYFTPNSQQRRWMAAQAHLVAQDEESIKQAKINAKMANREYEPPNLNVLGAEEAYTEAVESLNQTLNTEDMAEDFLSEKSYEFSRLVEKPESAKQRAVNKAEEGDLMTEAELELVRHEIEELMKSVEGVRRKYTVHPEEEMNHEKLKEPIV